MSDELTKTCTRCAETKPIQAFNNGPGSHGRRQPCALCRSTCGRSPEARQLAREYYHATKAARKVTRDAWASSRRQLLSEKQKAWAKTPRGLAQAQRYKESGRAKERDRRCRIKTESKAKAAAKHKKYVAERRWLERLADNHRIKKYGLARGQFESMLAERGNRCDICCLVIERRPCLDHDHATGAVRGILCNPCNSMLGQAKDSEDTLRAAIQYLRKHREVAA